MAGEPSVDMTGEIKRRIAELNNKAKEHYEQMIVCRSGAKTLESLLDETDRRAREAMNESEDHEGQ